MAKKSSRRGFTLLELIIVVTMIALIAAIVAPRMFQQSDSATERGDLRRMVSFVRTAKETAVLRGVPVVLRVDVEGRLTTEIGESVDVEGARELNSMSAPRGYSLAERIAPGGSVSGDDLIVMFYPDGSTTGGAFTYNNARGDDQLTISINDRTGFVKAQRGEAEEQQETRWRAGELERRT